MDKNYKSKKILKSLISITIMLLLVFFIYLILRNSGALDKIDDIEDLKTTIRSYGSLSIIALFIVQFLQATILPIPSIITTIAGVLVFGAWQCFFISILAITAGSIVSFYMGRYLGKGIIKWIVGEKDFIKLENKLTKGKYVYFLMMIFPLFPDDILCLMAGVTNMSFKFFFITNIITRPLSLLCLCFLGSGTLIPFSGWGIPVWIVLIIALIILTFVAIKYQVEIENYITKIDKKYKLKKQKRLDKKIKNLK